MSALDSSGSLVQALALHQKGRLAEAEALYRNVLAQEPGNADALHLLGVLNAQRGDPTTALSLIDQAIAVSPGNAVQLYNRGNALRALGRIEDALASYDSALQIAPEHAGALTNRGAVLQDLGRHDDALASYNRALASHSHNPSLLYNRANAFRDLGRADEALASYGAVLALDPRQCDALNNRGNLLLRLRRYDEALADYDAALTARPGHAQTLYNRGNLFLEQRRFEEALAAYDDAIAAKTDHAKALKGKGNVFFELRRYQDALAAYDAAFATDPTLDYLEGCRVHLKMHLCDWHNLANDLTALYRHVDEGRRASEPFMLLPTEASTQQQLRCAQIFAADRHPPAAHPVWRGEIYRHEKIRVAYVSGEFREQAVAYVTADLFECHDRRDFEIHGLATGIDDASLMRKRIEAAFDVFTDVSSLSDGDIADRVRRAEIDILIDLNGYFGVDRTGVFALKPAPVQVNYLGFPGTMGAPYIDYLIADETVIPKDARGDYFEKVVYLPGCYQPNDRKRAVAERVFKRTELGLPENGFVFCCFSTSHKLTPAMFDIWMRLLNEVAGSVLWLSGNALARSNLKNEAQKRSVAPNRIVFAQFLADPQDHLARLRAADLFLDTLPHNAHTTAADALWAGVPVLTAVGSTFPSRVAASLLKAAGLGELVTASLPEYEAAALALARDPSWIAAIRAKLASARHASDLFNTPRYARHIEAAYRTMRERQRRGLPPESFAVPGE
jgi:protein O-GlcNAc transferase